MNKIEPKTIKYKKNKTYTEKRDSYKSYLNAKWKWDEIFCEIDSIKNYTSSNSKKDK